MCAARQSFYILAVAALSGGLAGVPGSRSGVGTNFGRLIGCHFSEPTCQLRAGTTRPC
jgi:hypothetical protein